MILVAGINIVILFPVIITIVRVIFSRYSMSPYTSLTATVIQLLLSIILSTYVLHVPIVKSIWFAVTITALSSFTLFESVRVFVSGPSGLAITVSPPESSYSVAIPTKSLVQPGGQRYT